MRRLALLSTIGVFTAAAACSGTGGSKDLPASPFEPGTTSNITAPTPTSPSDDQQLDTLRPTLTVTNASGPGNKTYEFQISDNQNFTSATVTQSGVPEGSGSTSFTVSQDLTPVTRYYWRARAQSGGSSGAWSSTSRFRTQIRSFKSGNQAFDTLMSDSVADMRNRVFFFGPGDPNPGAKLDDDESFLVYRMAALPDGEVSFVARRVKPEQNGIIFSMQNGTGGLGGSSHQVQVEKSGSRVIFRFAGGQTEAGMGFADHTPYFFKVEWRAGTARLRIFGGENEAAPVRLDINASYSGPYNPSEHSVVIGALQARSLTDARISNLYIGPNARPVP